METKTVSAIVPIYKEERNAGKVIKSLIESGIISEIICVVDEPTSRCLQILRPFAAKIRLLTFKSCRGKGRALAAGVRQASGEIVVFFDSDLIGLSKENIIAFLRPILLGKTRIVVAAPQAELKSVFGKWVPEITGDRAYHRKDLLPYLEEMAEKGYGVELFLSNTFKKESKKIISFVGVINPCKEEKWSMTMALKRYLAAGIDLAMEIGRKEVLSQNDFDRLKDFAKIKTLENLEKAVVGLQNENVKRIFEKYILKYIKKIKS